MPDNHIVAAMYGPDYQSRCMTNYEIEDVRSNNKVLEFLSQRRPGLFLDFGCGDGRLLTQVRNLSWDAFGVEFDATVVKQTAQVTRVPIFTFQEFLSGRAPAVDAIHLGDVLEHLPDLDHQFALITKCLKPGGWLLAQGPLEGGPCLFSMVFRVQQWLRAGSAVEGSPYHVIQATASGQRSFFSRSGLEEIEYQITEVDWPAPSRLHSSDLGSPRTVALFMLRRVSKAVSRTIGRGRWGNRYFYMGRSR